jgi:hypothetical protein
MPNGKTHFMTGAVAGATVNFIIQSAKMAMDPKTHQLLMFLPSMILLFHFFAPHLFATFWPSSDDRNPIYFNVTGNLR